ncbi:MAG: amino acid ABC transporter permease [Bacillota bacterium]
MQVILDALPLLLVGAKLTLQITVLSVGFGCIIGLFAGLCRLSRSRVLRYLATGYVDFFRGTPLLVQIFMLYFGLPQVIEMGQVHLLNEYGIPKMVDVSNLSRYWIAVLGCSLNSGAYIAEIFRAGVQSIERGQMEAARSLGMTQNQAMGYVILPQAFKRVIPPLGNEFIAMLKDTSLLSVIGVEELTRKGQLIIAVNYQSAAVWFAVAMIYLIMTLAFSRIVDWLERRLKTDDRS